MIAETIQAPGVTKSAGNRALAEQYLQRGINHYDAQEVDQALAAYQQCIQADPTFGLGYNSLGMVLIDLERYDEALEALFQSIRCDNTYAEAYNNLGFVLRRMQRPLEAIAAYGCFLKLEPDVEEGPRIQGWMQTVMQENNLTSIPELVLPGAAPAAEEAPAPAPAPVAPAPPEPPAKIKKMAAWEVAAGNVETAAPVSVLGEIEGDAPAPPAPPIAPAAAPLPPHPGSAPLPAHPASAPLPPHPATATAAPAPAKTPLVPMRAAGMKPAASGTTPTGGAVALVEKGMDQFAEGNMDQAADLFQKAVAAEPNNPEGHIGLAKVWIRQEKLDEAIELLQKAVQMDLTDPAGFYVLGFALRAVERNVEASEAYEAFLKLMPNALDAGKMKSWVANVKGTDVSATPEGEESVEDDEQIVTEIDKKYQEALTQFQEGDVDSSLRKCIAVLNEDPGHIRTRVLLGRAYLRQKSFDNAIEQFEAALVTRPDYPEALYFSGQGFEKKGANDKATTSYKRYLDVAPTGPRAERLRDWLLTHGAEKAGSGKQAQCELCLRFFPENEMTDHEGRATCRNCMAVMGGTPTLETSTLPVESAPVSAAPIQNSRESAGPRRSKGVVILGALVGLGAVGGVLFYLGMLNPLLEKVGLAKPKPKPGPGPNVIIQQPVEPTDVFDASKVKIANEPVQRVTPLGRWTYTPVVEGLEQLEKTNPGWKKEYQLKNEPKGMTIDSATGQAAWTPEYTDFDLLKKGEAWKVELTVKGIAPADPKSLKPEAATARDLFTVTKAFTLGCQFGYVLTPEVDLGLAPDERVALAVGEFTGDDLPDAVIGTGTFREGALRLYVQRKDNPLPTAAELSGKTRFSALLVADLDGDKRADMLSADWLKGRVKLFYQKQNEFAGDSPEVSVGPGPVALAAADLAGDKKFEVAALLGPGNALAVTTLGDDHKFGDVITIPLSGIGGRGWVMPWTSAEAGPGFLVVSPLSATPLQFIPFNKGQWHKGSTGIVESSIDAGDVITAATVVSGGAKGVSRLAALVAGRGNRLLLYEEKNGKFTPAGQPVTLSGLGTGLLARDFNQDGQDDLFVVGREESGFYFSRGAELVPGPRYASKAKMLGPVALFSLPGNERPDLLLINEDRKAQILKAVINDPFAAPDYEIKVSRAFKVGDKYHIHGTGMSNTTAKTTSGTPAPDDTKQFRMEIDADVEVLAVNARGGETKRSYLIGKCVKLGDGDASKEILAKGRTLVAETKGNKTVFSLDGGPVTDEIADVLNVAIITDRDNAIDLTLFDPPAREHVGDTWLASPEALAAAHKKQGVELKPEDIGGRGKLESLSKVQDIDCLVATLELTLKLPPPKSADQRFEVTSKDSSWTLQLSLPMNSPQPPVQSKRTTIVTTKFNSKPGNPPQSMESTTTESFEVKQTPIVKK